MIPPLFYWYARLNWKNVTGNTWFLIFKGIRLLQGFWFQRRAITCFLFCFLNNFFLNSSIYTPFFSWVIFILPSIKLFFNYKIMMLFEFIYYLVCLKKKTTKFLLCCLSLITFDDFFYRGRAKLTVFKGYFDDIYLCIEDFKI